MQHRLYNVYPHDQFTRNNLTKCYLVIARSFSEAIEKSLEAGVVSCEQEIKTITDREEAIL